MDVSSGGAALAGRVVLVVEDDDDTREVLAALLASEGARVIGSASGRAALEALTGARVDLVITDYGMPEMDGLELLRELRASKAQPDVPVVMLTAHGSVEVRRDAESLGAAFLSKPADAELLLATVARLIARSTAA